MRTARNVIRTAVIGGGVTFLCWNIYSSTVLSPLIRHVEREYASLSPKERKELEEEMDETDDSIFIAFPFTTNKVIPKPYLGSDPEWHQFIQISKDKDLQERIRVDLADHVKFNVERLAMHRLGTNARLRRYWLDIDFPYRPAPTYEHSGVLVDDMGITWATEPVDSETVFRLRKILWPVAVAQSTWAFTTAMVAQHWAEVRRVMGYQPPPGTHTTPRSPIEAITQPKLPGNRRQTPDGTPDEPASNAVSKTTDPRQAGEPRSGGRTNFLKDSMSSQVDGVREMSSGPFMEFRKMLHRTWKPIRQHPPRGCIMVSGFVEIETTRGFVVADVVSHWNPKTQKFDSKSMQIQVRRIQMKVQAPATK